jgi:hypothetical protein
MNDLDKVQDMLAHFICADAEIESNKELTGYQKMSELLTEIDSGFVHKFQPRFPTVAYGSEMGGERIFANYAELLLESPQDLLGKHTEVTIVGEDRILWSCLRRIHKIPKGVWLSKAGADLYEYHTRAMFPDGSSKYFTRVAAIDKKGNPVKALIVGTRNVGNENDSMALILAASIVEDAHRPDVIRATLSDSVGITLPIKQGKHLELFKLRDGPAAPGGRRRPLMHWVASHVRKSVAKQCPVSKYLRGVHEFDIDGLHVKLEAST